MDSLSGHDYPCALAAPLHINALAMQLCSHGRSVHSGSLQRMPATGRAPLDSARGKILAASVRA